MRSTSKQSNGKLTTSIAQIVAHGRHSSPGRPSLQAHFESEDQRFVSTAARDADLEVVEHSLEEEEERERTVGVQAEVGGSLDGRQPVGARPPHEPPARFFRAPDFGHCRPFDGAF